MTKAGLIERIEALELAPRGKVWLAVNEDIADRKHAGQASGDSEARLRAVPGTAADGIITFDERCTIESLNPAAEKLFGYSGSEAKGRNIEELIPSLPAAMRDLAAGHAARDGSGRRRDGSTFPLELSVSDVEPGGRRIFTGIVRDITRRKQPEQALSESERRFRHLVETTKIIAWEVDIATSCFTYVGSWAV